MPRDVVEEAQKVLEEIYAEKGRVTPGGKVGFDDFYPVDLELAVQLRGWSCERITFPGYLADSSDLAIGQADPASSTVTIFTQANGQDVPLDRQRFTIAHELGHVVLHQKACSGAVLRRTQSAKSSRSRFNHPQRNSLEAEADKFATFLLMPRRAVEMHFSRLFGIPALVLSAADTLQPFGLRLTDKPTTQTAALSVATAQPTVDLSLARFFGVSARAMARRLLELDLVRA